MDPNATLRDLLQSLQERDTDAAREAFEALAGWIESGGFLPSALGFFARAAELEAR